jgi:hypothetical protein
MNRTLAFLSIFALQMQPSCKNRETESLPSSESAWSSDVLDGTISLSIQTANSMAHLGFYPEKSHTSVPSGTNLSDNSEEGATHLDLFSMGLEESLRRSSEIYDEILDSPNDSLAEVVGIAADQLTSLARLKAFYGRNLASDAAGIPRNFAEWIKTNRVPYQDFIREYDTNTTALVSIRDAVRGKSPPSSTQIQQGIYAQSPSIASCVTEIFTELSPTDPQTVLAVEIVPDTSADNDDSCRPAVLTCSDNTCSGKNGKTAIQMIDINESGFVLISDSTKATFLRRDVAGAARFKGGKSFRDEASPESRSILEPYISSSGQISGLKAEFYSGGNLVRIGHYLCDNKRCSQKCNTDACDEILELDESRFSILESGSGSRRFSLETPSGR